MQLLDEINNLITENEHNESQIKNIENSIIEINKSVELQEKDLEISQNAINLLRQVSEKTVSKSYEYLETTINEALERIFKDRKRKIKIEETTRSNQYPQTTLILTTENGEVELVDDGRGIGQIISFLVSICLIVITGSRRFMALDEVLDGLSSDALRIMDNIIHDFTDIGFQFLVNQHNFLCKGSKVYELEIEDGMASIKNVYIDENGLYNGQDVENPVEEEKEAVKGSKTATKGIKKAGRKKKTEEKVENIDNSKENEEEVKQA